MTTPSPLPPLASATDYPGGKAPADAEKVLGDASDAIRAEAGWHIAPVIERTVTLDGSGARDLMLPTLRLVELVSVVADGVALDVSALEWSGDGFLRSAGRWTSKLRGVVVTMRHGYDSVPGDVKRLAMSVASRADVVPAGVVREQVGSVSMSYAQASGGAPASGVALLDTEASWLAKYKLPPRP